MITFNHLHKSFGDHDVLVDINEHIAPGEKVVIVDDLIATGGTLAAACKLVEQLQGEVAQIAVVMELAGLNGRDQLRKYPLTSLITYEGK